MNTIDDVEELRAELAHCHLSVDERREAEARLAALLQARHADLGADQFCCLEGGDTSQHEEH